MFGEFIKKWHQSLVYVIRLVVSWGNEFKLLTKQTLILYWRRIREDGNIYILDVLWYLDLSENAHFILTHLVNGVVKNKDGVDQKG